MIKLETKSAGLSALAMIQVVSSANEPTISLACDKARKVNQTTQQWEDDPTKAKQTLTYVGADGPVEFSGLVPDSLAVEVNAAWKVVCLVDCSTRSLPATKAGGFSRSLVSLSLVQVVEVWESPTKCLWRDKAFSQTPAGKTFDMATGRIQAA